MCCMIGYPSYAVVAVSYGGGGGIDRIKRHRLSVDAGDGFEDVEKETVIEDIESGDKHFTLTLEQQEVEAEMVHVVEISDRRYIRTDRNRSDDDNLGDLPEY